MTSDTNPKTILLGGDPLANEGTVITAAITPGMMVLAAGNSVARAGAGAVSPSVARENELVGKGIADAYGVDDNILFYTPRKGDRFYALLAAGQDVAAGALLACGAAGALVAVGSAAPVARALEAVDNDPGTASAAVRIKVEIV